jgi:hypothetical protein
LPVDFTWDISIHLSAQRTAPVGQIATLVGSILSGFARRETLKVRSKKHAKCLPVKSILIEPQAFEIFHLRVDRELLAVHEISKTP